MRKHKYRSSIGKCVCGGIAIIFLISIAVTHGTVDLLSTAIIEKAHALGLLAQAPLWAIVAQGILKFIRDTALWLAQKAFFGLLLVIFIATLGRIIVWTIYTIFVSIAVPLIFIMIKIVESTVSSANGTIAYFLFYSPDIQSVIHRNIWTVSRNAVNIGFAAVFLFGAIMTIIKANKEFIDRYALKFLAAIILVNFSWFIPGVIVDAASIGTRAIFSLSAHVPCNNCKAITGVILRTLAPPGSICPTALICVKIDPIGAGNPANYVVSGLTTFLAQILQQGATLNPDAATLFEPLLNLGIFTSPASSFTETIELAMGLFLIMLGTGSYLIILAALALAFIIRLPILWITMGFMPFVALGFVADSIKPFTDKIWKKFLSAAFMPVMAGIPIAVGFIALQSIQNAPGTAAALNNITLTTNGVLSALPNFLFMALSIIILWMGVFAVLQSDEYIGMGSAAIKATGQKLGKIGAYGYSAGTVALSGGFGVAMAKRPLQALSRTERGKKWLGADKINVASMLAIPAQIMRTRQKLSPDQILANAWAGKPLFGAKTISTDKAAAAAKELKETNLGKQFQQTILTLVNKSTPEYKEARKELQRILDTLAIKVGDFDRSTSEQIVDSVKRIVDADTSIAGNLPSDWQQNLYINLTTPAPTTPPPPPPPPPTTPAP